MAIKIKFDNTYTPYPPTFVLVTRSGKKIGAIPANNIKIRDAMNTFSELFFVVNKEDNGVPYRLWSQIKDFKILWCREWNKCFEMSVEMDESNELIKNVTAKSLGESELSQINLYGIEINTESDIARDDYKETILYDTFDSRASLLNRIMEKAPHYRIAHVDSRIASIQRTFSFDNITIYDAMQKIAEEIHCIFIIDTKMAENGKIDRSISVYDLESYCTECGERGNFVSSCPECGGIHIQPGYGKDTTIFVSSENLADDITFTTDVDSVKNCFKLVAGDDLMTDTIANCNPDGSNYIWYISDELKEDMSDELSEKLEDFNGLSAYYQDEHTISIDSVLLDRYNSLIEKYSVYSKGLVPLSESIVGYSALMTAYYQTIDLDLYLSHSLMPDVKMQDTTAQKEAEKLTTANLSPVAVQDLNSCSESTASSAVLAMAKVLVDSRYRVKVNESSFTSPNWTGSFTITNYSDEEDTATSNRITVIINGDHEAFTRQKIDKMLSKSESGATDVVSLFDLSETDFKEEIKKYSLKRLNSFYDSCQACLDILIEQGVASSETWETSQNNDLYTELYLPYYNKLGYLSEEIKLRESEIVIITGLYTDDGEVDSEGIQTILDRERAAIQNSLDFESYLGTDLWLEFAAYRREDTYQNDNYISDSLDNSQLFEKALEFISVAKKEIVKSATLQHSISATLKNLLVMKEFAPLVDHFEVGNWIRVKVDQTVYRLRLLDYEIDFDNLDTLTITFSDVEKASNGMTDVESVLNQASSMAGSYGAVARQAGQGKNSKDRLDGWVEDGLSLTNMKIIESADNQNITWDSHGMLFKQYDSVTDEYSDCQLKIINSTLAITDNNWRSVKTAVGGYYYIDPTSGEIKYAYGVNAETLVGKLILGEQLGIYNSSGSMSFGSNGLLVTNGANTFQVDPNNEDALLRISNKDEDIFYLDKNGKLHIVGDGSGLDIASNDSITGLSRKIETTISGIKLEVTSNKDGMSSQIELKSGETSITSAKIEFDGVATFINSSLSTKGATIINASNITTGEINASLIKTGELDASIIKAGTLSADKISTGTIDATSDISLSGLFNVYNGTGSTKNLGGKIGYKTGSLYGIPTDGIAMMNEDETCYSIVTDSGVRLQTISYDTAKSYRIYISRGGAIGVNGDTVEITGSEIHLNGNVYINGVLAYAAST